MRLSREEKRFFIRYVREMLANERLLEMNQYIQHGNTTTLIHCLMVAYYSYLIALKVPFQYDLKSVIRGAMLHDFYLYDWHIPDIGHRLHGFKHPRFALNNARIHFTLNRVEEDIIEKHMWPLTLRKLPLYKESMLVCLVDKYCSFTETFYIPAIPKELKYLNQLIF